MTYDDWKCRAPVADTIACRSCLADEAAPGSWLCVDCQEERDADLLGPDASVKNDEAPFAGSATAHGHAGVMTRDGRGGAGANPAVGSEQISMSTSESNR